MNGKSGKKSGGRKADSPVKFFDFLVIGSGVAGLTYALKVAELLPDASIAILTKADERESNTQYAQGGIAAVFDGRTDSMTDHVSDTIIAGDGLCDKAIVDLVVSEGPLRLNELTKYGARFDKKPDGGFDLALEGGHSQPRVIHHKDTTGREIIRTLLKRVKTCYGIHMFNGHIVVDLITEKAPNGEIGCRGALAVEVKTGTAKRFNANTTLMAGGGIGHVYRRSTNPPIATGDGIAMAHRAGAKVEAMEFIQFHPTVFMGRDGKTPFLISEAVRGFGAVLRNEHGQAFMEGIHPLKDLAPRDVVSRAIQHEMMATESETVYLDATQLDPISFRETFPFITSKLKDAGLDPVHDLIPVTPAAHYVCGGIATDKDGRTTVPDLYAAGECAHTGLHGANRLASNSLLEALVFAHRAALHAVEGHQYRKTLRPRESRLEETRPRADADFFIALKKEIQNTMTLLAGIVRSQDGLTTALQILNRVSSDIEREFGQVQPERHGVEARNMALVARLIVEHSMAQRRNRGVFFKLATN